MTVGIHVQEMKGFRKEVILSIVSPHPFEDEPVVEEKSSKGVKRSAEKKEKSDKKRKV